MQQNRMQDSWNLAGSLFVRVSQVVCIVSMRESIAGSQSLAPGWAVKPDSADHLRLFFGLATMRHFDLSRLVEEC